MYTLTLLLLLALENFLVAGQCPAGAANIGPCPTGTCQTGATCTSGICCQGATTTCVDLINPNTGTSDCPSRAYLCNNSVYYALMTQQCPKTCNRCSGSGTPPSSSCVDLVNPSTGVSDCPSRAYLCNNSVYYTLMTQQCPKTCGRCSG
uniref:ShKT domain-containing protein n=1 Tax=Acrobeloides nanus TaxID=290746 RepID=A0A914DXT6_9BILA